MKILVKDILSVIFLPVTLMVATVKSSREGWKKAVYILIVLILFTSLWFNILISTIDYISSLLFLTGVKDKLTEVHVVGTSMLPTITDGSTVTLSSPKKYGLSRGDIVSFQNKETGGYYYIKRIIGLEGEEIVIKLGRVYLNSKPLNEPYTLNSLPTFGNTALGECEKYTVPADSFAVFGDNRTVSQDSRVIGFVNRDDIEGVIPADYKLSYASPTERLTIEKKTVDPILFLEKINKERGEKKLPLLVTHDLLNNLAKDRANDIKNNFNQWKKNESGIERFLDNSGYKFNQVYEFITFGYIDGSDVLDQVLESPREKDKFFSSEFTEVGVGVVERTYGECTYPIVAVILSWPSVPTYDATVIKSWEDEIANTNKILSDLQSWVGYREKDQEKLRELISIIAEENQIARRIYARMNGREWLSQKDYDDIEKHDKLVTEGNKLMDELFPRVKGIFSEDGKQRKL